MTRIVGSKDRSEFVADPATALRRGRIVDAMLASAMLARPRGVIRATHARLNEIDDERRRQQARRLNSRP